LAALQAKKDGRTIQSWSHEREKRWGTSMGESDQIEREIIKGTSHRDWTIPVERVSQLHHAKLVMHDLLLRG